MANDQFNQGENFRPPSILYKYLGADLIHILDSRQLKCTPHQEFQDLFDSSHAIKDTDPNVLNVFGAPYYFMEMTPDDIMNREIQKQIVEILENWTKKSVEMYPVAYLDVISIIDPIYDPKRRQEFLGGFRDNFTKKTENLLVLSLTEDCTSRLMWERYADESRGFCIGLSNNSQFLSGQRRGVLRKIIYSDEPSSGPLEVAIWRRWIVKHPDYSYEKEWRVRFFEQHTDAHITNNGLTIRTTAFAENDFKQIIFGARSTEHFRHESLEKIPNHIEEYNILPNYKQFTLDRIQ